MDPGGGGGGGVQDPPGKSPVAIGFLKILVWTPFQGRSVRPFVKYIDDKKNCPDIRLRELSESQHAVHAISDKLTLS